MMKTMCRIFCAIFGHLERLVREFDDTYYMFVCARCEQTTWREVWKAHSVEKAVWGRLITDEEIQALRDCPPAACFELMEEIND